MTKKFLSALVVAALGLSSMPAFAQLSGQINTIPGLPQALSVIPTGGPQNRVDGTAGAQLADREGNTKATLGHAEYTESARRGRLFTLAANAYTIIAANASVGNLGTFKPIVGFYNPTGSGVNAVIVNHKEFHTSGTPGGPLIWNFYCGQNWTTAASGTIYNNLLSNNTPNGSAMIAQNNALPGANPAIGSALLAFGPAGGPTTGASALGEVGTNNDDKGQIVVQPGCLFGLASTATGSTDIVSASITWEEVVP